MQICAACGQENPEGFRLCGMCGASLVAAAASAGEERKVVTVLFTDLVGFTSRAEQLDPEDVRATLMPYYARLRAEIERHGGTVEKFIGDAVMAVFGAPVAHEDDPERAVRAALAIRESVDDLQIRTAVNTGEALVALGARPNEGEAMVSGDVVNTAARLQSAAPVNGILVGEATYRATRHVIDYREAASVDAKGKVEPVPVWEAVAARSRLGIDVDQRPSTRLVGRLRELGFLTDALERSRTDRTAQLVTLVGVPGIGKSRLVAELFQLVDAEPDIYAWRQGRSLPYGETQSLWALAEIVKAQAGILETDDTDATVAKLDAMVESAAGDEGDRAWVARHIRPLVGLSTDADATGDRAEAFSAWRRLLEDLAEQRPLVLVFEDLHWADDALLDFVDHLADWVTTVPMLIVGTARPELLDRRPGWGGGKRNASTVSIAPLDGVETAQLLGSLLDQALLPAEVQSQVLTRAEGNPLYAEEYVRMLQDRGFLVSTPRGWQLAADGDLPLPESVQGMIAARLDALPAAEKQLVQDASILGKVFWPGALGGADDGMLHALERKEFVRRDRRSAVAGETQYAFLHLLVRDVAYSQIPRAQRVEKHRLAAEWIGSLARDRTEDRAEMLAHHYREALRIAAAAGVDAEPLRAPARAALIEASERAASLSAWTAALEATTEALELVDADDPKRPQLLLRRATANFHNGGGATDDARAALDGFLAFGERALAAEAAAFLSRSEWYLSRGEEARAAAAQAVDLARAEVVSGATTAALSQAARLLCLNGEDERALGLARETLAMAEQIQRDDLMAHALSTIGMCRLTLDDEGGIEDLERSVQLAVQTNSPDVVLVARNNLANNLWLLGRLDEAAEQLAAAHEMCLRFGYSGGFEWLAGEAICDAFLRGAVQEVLTLSEQMLTSATDRFYQEAATRLIRAAALLATGRQAEALEHVERGLELARESGDPQQVGPALVVFARTLAAAGRVDEAQRVLAEVTAQPRLAVDQWTADLPLFLLEQGRAEEYLELAPEGGGFAWRRAGRLAASGDLTGSAAVYAEIGARFQEAWARLLAAERGEVGQLERARAYFAEQAALPYVARCDAVLAASA